MIIFYPAIRFNNNSPNFQGKTESFWEAYNRKLAGVPLKDTVIKSISDDKNLLGEGLSKKGYSLIGLKDYVIRVYKNCFKIEDLNSEFEKPEKNYLNTLDGVVLCIPNKIDIVKRKNGINVGVDNYAKRIWLPNCCPLENINITREETLKSLELYEQAQNFPIKSYKSAYKQIENFCKKKDFQFDIISPNNVLVDNKAKRIDLIDPVSPEINKPAHGTNVDFSIYHGADSLYPVFCDFLLQKEHLKNLTKEEQIRWKKATSNIISKCISGGTSVGLKRNLENLRTLYRRVDKFWGTYAVEERFDYFLSLYEGVINRETLSKNILDHTLSVPSRIEEIKTIDSHDFEGLRPIFEEIFKAPHQPKVEFPEILDATLDKINEYGKSAKSITPAAEKLFDKEIFYTTKHRLYNLFINVNPENKKFLEEINKSSLNPVERVLYKNEIEKLYKQSTDKKISPQNRQFIKQIYKNYTEGEKFPEELVNKICMSRTCTSSGEAQSLFLENVIDVYNYIEAPENQKINIENLIEIHKRTLAGTPEEYIAGMLRTPETDEMIIKLFNIKVGNTKPINDYSDSKNVVKDLKDFDNFIKENYDKKDTFTLASEIFSKIIQIHPFLNGNGRACRLFVEMFLLSKGYRLTKWPEEALYRKICTDKMLAEVLKENSVKI